jgi:hypothetical protein
MQPSSQSASVSMRTSAVAVEFPRANDDWAYQAFTVAAILLVLASLWVF